MSGSVQVDPDDLASYGDYLESVSGQFDTIKDYVHQYACNKDGFTGLLMLLQPGVDLVENLFDRTLQFGKDKLHDAADGIQDTAQAYRDREAAIQEHMNAIINLLQGVDV